MSDTIGQTPHRSVAIPKGYIIWLNLLSVRLVSDIDTILRLPRELYLYLYLSVCNPECRARPTKLVMSDTIGQTPHRSVAIPKGYIIWLNLLALD